MRARYIVSILITSLFISSPFVLPKASAADDVTQSDCAAGEVLDIVTGDGTTCVKADTESDPEGCSALSDSEAVTRCLEESRRILTDDGALSPEGTCSPGQSVFGIPTWYKYLEGDIVSGKCRPKLDTTSSSLPIGLAVLEAALTLGGIVAVVMIFFGSFKFVTSEGEPDKANGARKTVINSVVGLVIMIVATRVVSFIAGRLG